MNYYGVDVADGVCTANQSGDEQIPKLVQKQCHAQPVGTPWMLGFGSRVIKGECTASEVK